MLTPLVMTTFAGMCAASLCRLWRNHMSMHERIPIRNPLIEVVPRLNGADSSGHDCSTPVVIPQLNARNLHFVSLPLIVSDMENYLRRERGGFETVE